VHTLNIKPNFKFSRLKFFGKTPVPVRVCASKAWSISSACKILRAQRPLRAEILCPEKCPLGWVNMHLYNFFECRPKFTGFLLTNLEGAVVHHLLFRFLMCPPVPEIFAIKVESCQKSRRNLDVFWRAQILGGEPSRNCTHVINPTSRHVGWKSLMRIFPLARKL